MTYSEEQFMSKLFKKTSISLLLIAGMGSAYANPGQGMDWRDVPRPSRQLRMAEQQDGRGQEFQVRQQNEQRREFQMRQQVERNRPPAGPNQPPSGTLQNNQRNNSYGVAPDAGPRPGRMSPEERRALRRQINEAGRDIYTIPR